HNLRTRPKHNRFFARGECLPGDCAVAVALEKDVAKARTESADRVAFQNEEGVTLNAQADGVTFDTGDSFQAIERLAVTQEIGEAFETACVGAEVLIDDGT